jgi:hypothetical protein
LANLEMPTGAIPSSARARLAQARPVANSRRREGPARSTIPSSPGNNATSSKSSKASAEATSLGRIRSITAPEVCQGTDLTKAIYFKNQRTNDKDQVIKVWLLIQIPTGGVWSGFARRSSGRVRIATSTEKGSLPSTPAFLPRAPSWSRYQSWGGPRFKRSRSGRGAHWHALLPTVSFASITLLGPRGRDRCGLPTLLRTGGRSPMHGP